MRKLLVCGSVIMLLAGCAAQFSSLPAEAPAQVLTLRWQRLVDAADKTCPRCASTEQEVQKAYRHLQRSLAPAGIAVRIEADRLDEAGFLQAPLESNKIWINGRLLEEWLGAQSASSPCTGCCGNRPCRTVELCGKTYEAIPAGLIVRAGFIAAGQVLADSDVPESPASMTGK